MAKPARLARLLDHLANELGALYPTYRLMEEGHRVNVLTLDGGPALRGHSGMALERFITVKGRIATARPASYDGVICPGGFSADKVRADPKVQKFIQTLFKQGKLVAHFGHGSWVTLSAGVLKGKRCTCPPQIRQDLINWGAIPVSQAAVVDGNVVSGNDWGAWSKAVIRWLENYQK